MDNHYHLLIETPEANLVQGMQRLNSMYAQHFNRRHHRVGHLWQGRYKSIVVDRESHLLELVRYIVLNPVRAGMVEQAGAWPWSSFRAMSNEAPRPSWLDVAWLLSQFGGEECVAIQAYCRFVQEGLRAASPWTELRGQIWLGRTSFREHMQSFIAGQALMQQQQMQVILTIFDTNPENGITQAKTRITLDNARIVGVAAAGDASSTEPQMTTQELVRVLAQRVIVEDLVAGTSFQYDFATAR
jgi:hypothetical protein